MAYKAVAAGSVAAAAPAIAAQSTVVLPQTASDAELRMIAGAVLLTLSVILLLVIRRRPIRIELG